VKAILPGSAIGVLGGGQLGRMLALAARRMGYRVHTFSPEKNSPAGQVADVQTCESFNDMEAVAALAKNVRVVTLEFENVPIAAVETAARHVPVRPAGSVLHTTQHRIREKTFLRDAGFPVTPFFSVRSERDLKAAVERLGLPGVLKTAEFGYDGKGQVTIQSLEQGLVEIEDSSQVGRIYETFVDFDREMSVVAARGIDGQFAHWGLIENRHRNHILDFSSAPANVPAKIAAEAVEIARGIVEKLDVVGVLCVEFFLTRDEKLLVNELAPRPHNSGHFTIDACATSQFEQQLRAVTGLPLGSTRQHRPAAMANLLGDLWERGTPNWAEALKIEGVKLHLYGKAEARIGRKMGHLTALGDSVEEAVERVLEARGALGPAD
jgi:5-(carboxyamino)imidazole ribonucleotide synthase